MEMGFNDMDNGRPVGTRGWRRSDCGCSDLFGLAGVKSSAYAGTGTCWRDLARWPSGQIKHRAGRQCCGGLGPS
jgi:hypothetical protein